MTLLATARLDALFTLRGVIAAALAYGAVNAALTLAAGPALALDDVKLNVLTQSFQAGYLPDNPPLFEWTLLLAQQALGPALASFVAVKTVFLVLTAIFTYLAAKEAGGDARIAGAAALALPLIPQFGWSFHQTLTHSTALFAATAFFWFALLRLRRRAGVIDLALFGAAAGAGVLAKYSFAGAAAAAVAAALIDAPLRRALMSAKAAAAVAAFAAVAAPHLAWAASAGAENAALVGARLAGEGTHAARAAKGAASVLWAAISFFAPVAIAAALSLRGDFPARLRGVRGAPAAAAALSLAMLLAAVAISGVSNFPERYAISFFFPGYLWLAALGAGQGGPAFSPNIVIAALAAAVLFAGARLAELARPGAPFCEDCRQYIPYTYLTDAFAGDKAEGATLVGFDDHTAGNLRRLFPRARVISSHQPFYAPPARQGGGCFFIWSNDLSPAPPAAVVETFDRAKIRSAGGVWRRVMAGEEEARKTMWSIAEVDSAGPVGADLCRR